MKRVLVLMTIASLLAFSVAAALLAERVQDLVLHPDGKRLGFSTRVYKPEIWVMENFLPAAYTQRTSARR